MSRGNNPHSAFSGLLEPAGYNSGKLKKIVGAPGRKLIRLHEFNLPPDASAEAIKAQFIEMLEHRDAVNFLVNLE